MMSAMTSASPTPDEPAAPPDAAVDASPDGASSPDGAPAEPADPTEGIGRRVARIRAHRGLGVSALARRAGVSPSLISQIEHGQSRPSVSSLFAISRALEVPVDAFFQDAAPEDGAANPPPEPAVVSEPPSGPRERYLVHRDERATVEIEGGVRWERLTPQTLPEMDFLELVYAPGAQSNESLYRHPGDEAVLVLSGRLDIYVGFERYELGPGDSMHFPSSRPHRYVNPTDGETRAITVIRHDVGGG